MSYQNDSSPTFLGIRWRSCGMGSGFLYGVAVWCWFIIWPREPILFGSDALRCSPNIIASDAFRMRSAGPRIVFFLGWAHAGHPRGVR